MLNQFGEAPILTSFKLPLSTVGAACAESWSSHPEDADGVDVRRVAHRAKPNRDRLDLEAWTETLFSTSEYGEQCDENGRCIADLLGKQRRRLVWDVVLPLVYGVLRAQISSLS